MPAIAKCVDIRGLTLPGSDGRVVKFIQYADDATCVATSGSDVKYFFSAFHLFQSATGATINLGKTRGLRLGGFVGRKLCANIAWSDVSIKLTGVIFGSPDAVLSNWTKRVVKAKTCLGLWRSRNLLLPGRVLVTNVAIYPLFYYLARVFPVPASISNELDKAVFKFLWAGKPELVARKAVCLPKTDGGLGIDSFRDKANSLLVRPKSIFPVIRGDPPIAYFFLTRYFIASSLRVYFPNIWSNSKPNSSECSFSLNVACEKIIQLFVSDNDFPETCKTIKDVVSILRSKDIKPSIVCKYPSLPWVHMWESVFNPMLDHKLVDFSWRSAHRVLYTKAKLKSWKVSNGLCKVTNCGKIETIEHIFWECSKSQPVLNWVQTAAKDLLGNAFDVSRNYFILGSPAPVATTNVLNRVWYAFVVAKHTLWRCRCIHVYEDRVVGDNDVIDMIRTDIKNKVSADFRRLTTKKFSDVCDQGEVLCASR